MIGPASGALPGPARESWQVRLHFQPGQAGERIVEAAPLARSSQEMNGITLTLESIAQTVGMDALKVGLQTDDPNLYLDPNWEYGLIVKDRDGQSLLLEPTSIFDQNGYRGVLLQTPILRPGQRYSLSLQGPIEGYQYIPSEDPSSHFNLDLGSNPQPGQSWKLDQTLQAAGKVLHLTGAHLLAGNACDSSGSAPEGTASLTFDFDPQPGVFDVMVTPVDETPRASRIYQRACIVYPEPPSDLLRFQISNIYFPIEGHWEISWQMPVK
jgi:hypothetical protein